MAKVKTIHHINLRPSRNDYDAMLKFYCEDLGMKVINSWMKYRGSFVSRNCYIDAGNGILIEACETDPENKKAGVIQHMALAVDDCEAVISELKAKGYTVVNSKGQPSEDLCIEVAVGEPIIRCKTGFVLSPSGELVEFVQDL